MNEKVTSLQLDGFLRSFEELATVEIIEGAKEKDDIIKIANAKGIDLKKNDDISGFKCIYAFVNRPNANGDYLPEKPLLKALPSIIGKPVNISHDRRYVIGHILDYRYRQKEKQVIAYGVIYKSCFKDEWKALKKDFTDKKLTVSFEIFSPINKRKIRENGVTELYDMTLAGMAILPRGTPPAFKGANVLAIARKKMDSEKNLDLVYASKYEDKDIITADYFKDSIKENHLEMEKQQKEKEDLLVPKIKCSNCQEEFESIEATNIRCPKCFAILSKTGEMNFPPQIKNFAMGCPACRMDNWLILSTSETGAKLRCQSCAKQYEVEFSIQKKSEIIDNLPLFYEGSTNCLQCGNYIQLGGSSKVKTREVVCKRCQLHFSINIEKINKNKQIIKISELIEEKKKEPKKEEIKDKKIEENKNDKVEDKKEKSSEKGGDKEVIVPKEIVEKVNEEAKEKAKEDNVVEVKDEKVEEIKVEDKVEKSSKEKVLKKAKEESKEVKEKAPKEVSEETKETPVEEAEKKKDETEVTVITKPDGSFFTEKELKDLTVKTKPVKSEKISTIRKAVTRILSYKKKIKELKSTIAKEEILKAGIKKVASQLIKANAEIKKIKSEADKKIKFYLEDAKEIIERRNELGDEYSKDLSDKDIMNADKFKIAKLEKETSLLKASAETTDEDDIVGEKRTDTVDEEIVEASNKIDKIAFSKKNERNKKIKKRG